VPYFANGSIEKHCSDEFYSFLWKKEEIERDREA
jgi:hypothetical protein